MLAAGSNFARHPEAVTQHRPDLSSRMSTHPPGIRELLHRFAAESGNLATFCPSEVARALAPDWRLLMPMIREVAAVLIAEGRLRCTQRGVVVDPLKTRGPIRLSAP